MESKELNSTADLMVEMNQKADRSTTIALICYFVFGIFLSFFYDTYLIALGVGGINLVAFFVSKSLLPNSSFYRYVLGGVYAVFAAQFIFQMHGLFEMHFFVFVGSTLLIAYQNWKLQLPLILLVVLHHAAFAYLQYSGMKEIYFTQLAYMDLQTFMFHGGLAAVIVAICGYWAFDLERVARSESRNRIILENQLVNVKNNISFAEQISQGNLSKEYKLLDEGDELGKSLLQMRSSLQEAAEREKKERFVTIGITKVGDIIREFGNDTQKLADEFIRGLVKYSNLNQGGLFLLDEKDEDAQLHLASCYAYDRKKYQTKVISIGNGLVGQCFLEREPIYMTNVPKNYVEITSGLGGATPRCIYLVPVKTEDDIVGVIELASFNELQDHEKEFFQKAGENIASAILSSHTTQKIKALLQESQQQTEEMKSQEEEMRQNMEELQATQEEMSRKGNELNKTMAEMQGVLSGINATMATIDFTPDGTILSANANFLKVMGYKLDEIKGSHHRKFVPKEILDTDEYKTFWTRLASGKSASGMFKRVSSKGDTIWLNAIYNPILDTNGEVIKVVKFATDISAEQEMMAESKGILNGINATMATIEFTPDGKILSANDNFLKTMKYNLADIKGTHHKKFVPKEILESDDYKTFWIRLGAGESISGVFKRITSTGDIVWLNAIYNPILNTNGDVTKIVKFATNVTSQQNVIV
ncbi:MAG TPA: PAS domain S-box protein [Chryseolinea sp.]|mgnify:CR=1 FL=1|nr:PAS domain S-box protein [Chryseolinea sp.]HPM29561.1 PAS domain S-box protein [Chryseolinea sp.]